jgi:opacity protein-like surface antigen
MSFAVDRYRNISDITGTSNLAQGGLGLAGAGISASESTQSTAYTFRSNYQFSEQTLVFGVVSDTLIDFIGQPFVVSSWLASMGIRHQLRQNVSLTFDYQYIRYISNQPLTSFTRNLVSVGAIYSF